jgi:hypothetical protein
VVGEGVPPTFSAHLPVGSLRWKNIGDEGARDLGAALRVNITQKTLKYAELESLAIAASHLLMGSLGGNNIGAAGARDLGAALQVNTTLTTLQ